MASFVDNFYIMDPFAPPAPGTTLTRYDYVVDDRNNNNSIGDNRDRIDGQRITASYPGDTVTVRLGDGSLKTITGVTFYLADGRRVFSPIDGSTLQDATFVSSTWVSTNSPVTPDQMQLTCFAAGTRILTPDGPRRVETLAVGGMVVTLDHGARPVRWIGRREVEGQGDFAPVRFMPGAIGNRRALRVSPQHRMLISGWQVEMLFGAAEQLVAAKHLVNGDTIHFAPCARIDYVHLMFDRHELILAEGVPTESFFPGDCVLARDRELLAELTALFPGLPGGDGWQTARPVLKAAEATLVV